MRRATLLSTSLVLTFLLGGGSWLNPTYAQPVNDDIVDAVSIDGGGTYTGSNVDATAEAGEPLPSCTVGGQVTSIYWAFTPDEDDVVTIDASGATFDTVLSLLRADDLTEVACDDDGGDGTTSLISDAQVTAGTTYLVRIAGFGAGKGGDITFDFVTAAPPLPEIHDTGVVQMSVFEDGFIGASFSTGLGIGFVFNGENGLFEGELLLGLDGEVTGSPYDVSEYTTISDVAPAPTPPGFDQAFAASFSSPLGLDVVHLSYSNTGDPYVILDYQLTNTTGGPLAGVYCGQFADWDVGNAGENVGDFDADHNLVYVSDDSGTSTNVFGVAALSTGAFAPVSGWDVSAAPDPDDDTDLYESLTTGGDGTEAPDDRRTVLGVGPYDLAPDETALCRFAWIGGTDLADLMANAQAAQDAVTVAVAPGPDGQPETHALSAVYPNPFTSRARVVLEVAEPQEVRVAVYDALGREVAVLHEAALAPGTPHEFVFDASALSSGVYLVRITGEYFTDTRRVTLIRTTR